MSRLSRIDLVVVDYLQLATGEGDTRAEEVGNIAAGLKAMAKEIDSPVIALSQLSRDVEKRPDRVPRLSDLRESGAIEQHADDVLFIHRPEKFDIESYAGYDTKGKAWIIVAKQREGPLDEVRLEYVPRFTRFIEPYSIKNGENV
jgi:replicative DNA helicase